MERVIKKAPSTIFKATDDANFAKCLPPNKTPNVEAQVINFSRFYKKLNFWKLADDKDRFAVT